MFDEFHHIIWLKCSMGVLMHLCLFISVQCLRGKIMNTEQRIADYSERIDLFGKISAHAIDMFLLDALSTDRAMRADLSGSFSVVMPVGVMSSMEKPCEDSLCDMDRAVHFKWHSIHRCSATVLDFSYARPQGKCMQTLLGMGSIMDDSFNTPEDYLWNQHVLEECLAKFKHLVETRLLCMALV